MVMEWVDSLGPASDSLALQKAGLRPADVMRMATEALELPLGRLLTLWMFCLQYYGSLSLKWKTSGTDGLQRSGVARGSLPRYLDIRFSPLATYIAIHIRATCWCAWLLQGAPRSGSWSYWIMDSIVS